MRCPDAWLRALFLPATGSLLLPGRHSVCPDLRVLALGPKSSVVPALPAVPWDRTGFPIRIQVAATRPPCRRISCEPGGSASRKLPRPPAIVSSAAESLLLFWGKARPRADAPPGYPLYHPVGYHLLDVAAVVEAILDVRPQALQKASQLLRAPDADARRLLVTLAALHDLGKFAPAFQAKVPALWPNPLGPLQPERILPGHHTEDGLTLWSDSLAESLSERIWPGAETALSVLAPAVFGHHGRPAGARPQVLRQRFPAAAREAARQCADAMVCLLCPEAVRAVPLPPWHARVASWWVAGLMTTADWIGSGERWFPYTAPIPADADLETYWAHARAAAARAVLESGLVAPPTAPIRPFARLTGLDRSPTPVQNWAQAAPLPAGPCLVVIEDVTGAGKTEAAQVIVHRLMSNGRAAGAYWAMPTQATANAMYLRQAATLDQLYADGPDPKPSLVLAHASQRLHERFRASVLDGATDYGSEARDFAAERSADSEDAPGTVVCAAFLADDRRAALLADVGAGTIDQAILGVLPSRFNALRLFGLADKVLVVDEAHAYDAYMSVELQELLRFHATLGGCAIVLSATLSRAQRTALAHAWADGLRQGGWNAGRDSVLATEPLYSDAYPLATVASAEGAHEQPLATAPWSARSVAVRMVHELDDALAHAQRMSAAGAAVAWIRNTVDDCLNAAAQLRARGVRKVIIFHARFAQCDRQAREEEVLERFGKHARVEDRAGWVLVATQVVEQSLDLDFDVMLSDLAPIDLLIQRAGRLWRHAARDAERPAGCLRELVVLSPPADPDPPRDWMSGPFRGTAAVYRHIGVLWRTARLLTHVGRIETPQGLRSLIEGVYASDEVPDSLYSIVQEAEGAEAGNAATAQYATLKVGHGYDAAATPWLSELRVPTRLGEEQTAVRLARVLPHGELVPWAQARPEWRAWALSEVRIRSIRIPPGALPPPEHSAAAAAARSRWGRFEQDLPLLALSQVPEEPGVWRGCVQRPREGDWVQVRYSASQGFAFEPVRRGG